MSGASVDILGDLLCTAMYFVLFRCGVTLKEGDCGNGLLFPFYFSAMCHLGVIGKSFM